MKLQGLTIGFALTGSFCTIDQSLAQLRRLVAEGAKVLPILSFAAAQYNTRVTTARALKKELKAITGREPLETIMAAEPIGPKAPLDILVVSPCTGNTAAKIANAITDTPVTMAVKAQLRNGRPVVLSIATNDGLGANAKNIGLLLNMKQLYFVPFCQDDPIGKRFSLTSKTELTIETIEAALKGAQLQPVLQGK